MEYERTKASKIGVGKSRKRIISREGGDHLSSTSSASKKFPPIRISPTLLILFIQIFIATRASHTISVTRFGEILPLWVKFTSHFQICYGLFLICQNAGPTLANL